MCSFALWSDFYLIKGEQEERQKSVSMAIYESVCTCMYLTEQEVGLC